MTDFKRYVCSKDKSGEYGLYSKKTGKGLENWVSTNRDKLWQIVKADLGATKHFRRRGEWIVCTETAAPVKETAAPVKTAA